MVDCHKVMSEIELSDLLHVDFLDPGWLRDQERLGMTNERWTMCWRFFWRELRAPIRAAARSLYTADASVKS
jgi:hypothetical protein